MEEPYLVLADMYSSMKDYGKAVETLTSGQVHMGKQEALLLRTVKARLAMKEHGQSRGGAQRDYRSQ